MSLAREIVFLADDFKRLSTHLLKDEQLEQLAFAFAGVSQSEALTRLLVREIWPVEATNHELQTPFAVQVSQDFMRRVLGRVHATGMGLLEIHSHPACDYDVTFSPTDLATEQKVFPYVARSIPKVLHATMVMGGKSVDAHLWDRRAEAIVPIQAVRIVGYPPGYLPTTAAGLSQEESPAHGSTASQKGYRIDVQASLKKKIGLDMKWSDPRPLETLRIGVVGPADVTEPLAQRLSAAGFERISQVCGASVDQVEKALKHADLVVSATSAASALAILNAIATRHYLPTISLVSPLGDSSTEAAQAGVFVVFPGNPCLHCQGVIAAAQTDQPEAPFSSQIAEQGIQEVLAFVRSSAMPQSYRLTQAGFEPLVTEKQVNCPYCGEGSPAGQGDL